MSHKLLSGRLQDESLNVLDQDLFFLLACAVELPVSFVHIVLENRELLQGPLFDINQKFDLFAGISIQPRNCLLQLREELFVVLVYEIQCVDC